MRKSVVLASALMPLLATAASAAPKALLVVSVTKGFRHESIPVAERLIEQLAKESGRFTVDFARSDEELKAKMSKAALPAYDGVFFASTTGDLPLPDREAFLEWVEGGKALVGIHAASDTFHGWRPYIEMLGGEFDYHRRQAKVAVQIDDGSHPATQGIPPGLEVYDEIYLFKSFSRQRVHMLLSMGRHPNSGEPGYYPLAWTRAQGKGRVFYTALGHRDDVLEAAWYRKHLLGGVLWALGAEGAAQP
jgi:type 1 glutamine amidotransferase